MKKPQQRERGEQAGIVKLLRSLGAKVYTLGTTRRSGDFMGTMQTPGLPDVIAFLPASSALTQTGASSDACRATPRRLLFVEVKAPGGRLRPEQVEFREASLAANLAHVVGGLDVVVAWLIANGYLRDSQVPHDRARQESPV